MNQAWLTMVTAYADRILREAGDIYHPTPSPLLANGVNTETGKQLRWIFPGGATAVVSDLASQQNLMRVFTALSHLTGDPTYYEKAKNNFTYYFDHYQDPGGLFYWGGHCFVDFEKLAINGMLKQGMIHELKNNFPFYELMFEINPEGAAKYIRAFWNAHIYNWNTLEMGRHGQYGLPQGDLWDSEFTEREPFFETQGLSFLVAGNDLIYAGGMLYKHTGEAGALIWSKRLAERYVKARHPVTGLGVYQFTQPKQTKTTTDDNITLSWYGDRAKRQFGPEFGPIALEGNLLQRRQATVIYSENALIQLQLAKELGSDAAEFLEWTRQGMAAYYKYAYIPETNMLRPLFTDGTDLTGFTLKRNGYFGMAGDTLHQFPASEELLLSYARGFLLTGDPDLWTMARGIARGHDLGDFGVTPGRDAKVNLATMNDSAFALFSVLDIYAQTGRDDFLALARAIGNNIVRNKYQKGYFLPGEEFINANIDAIEPYALLALEAAVRGMSEKVPAFINGSGYLDGEYLYPNGEVRMIHDTALFMETREGTKYVAETHRFSGNEPKKDSD